VPQEHLDPFRGQAHVGDADLVAGIEDGGAFGR
jgi:hypothetical protein